MTKVSLFIANYGRELRIGVDLRRKEKIEKVMEFAEKMRKVQEKAEVVLKRMQEEMRRQVDREKKEVEKWKVGDRAMLSMKDLVFKEKPVKKLVNQYMGLYIIDKIIFANTVKLRLLILIRIHLVVNVNQIVWYKDQVEEQKKEKIKLVKIEGVEEWEVEKI